MTKDVSAQMFVKILTYHSLLNKININNYAFMQVLDFCLAVWREELAQEVSYDIDMCSVVHCSLKCISGI